MEETKGSDKRKAPDKNSSSEDMTDDSIIKQNQVKRPRLDVTSSSLSDGMKEVDKSSSSIADDGVMMDTSSSLLPRKDDDGGLLPAEVPTHDESNNQIGETTENLLKESHHHHSGTFHNMSVEESGGGLSGQILPQNDEIRKVINAFYEISGSLRCVMIINFCFCLLLKQGTVSQNGSNFMMMTAETKTIRDDKNIVERQEDDDEGSQTHQNESNEDEEMKSEDNNNEEKKQFRSPLIPKGKSSSSSSGTSQTKQGKATPTIITSSPKSDSELDSVRPYKEILLNNIRNNDFTRGIFVL
jgi:hypothetical protein